MISVCIPVYEQSGYGAKYLAALLDSIAEQKGVELEVVVSDNSKDDACHEVCYKYAFLPLQYIRNNKTFGVSNNTNNAIEHALYDNIKIMYSDDLLLTPDALQRFEKALSERAWAASASRIIDKGGVLGRVHKPSYNANILQGRNTIGMPSCIAMRKNGIRFDPNLTTCLDCEYYWLLYREFGEPAWIREPLVGQRYWHGQMSRKEPNHALLDFEYLKNKYPNENLVCDDATYHSPARRR